AIGNLLFQFILIHFLTGHLLLHGGLLELALVSLLEFIFRNFFPVHFSDDIRHTLHVGFRHFLLLAFTASFGRLASFFTAARSRLSLGLLLIFRVSCIFTRIISTAAGTEYQHR